ncbi:MAG: hydantoinase B/oxoprolinase family protein [Devosia sp.]|nr:hydantoinase B/oxoprolinase family protein [Devosia sp.]
MNKTETTSSAERGIDLLTMTVLLRSIESTSLDMSNALLKTGRAGLINTAFDFSCTFVDRDFRTVNTSVAGLPLHLNSIDLIPRSIAKKFGDGISAGDCFASNSAYLGNTHCGDLTLVAPVIIEGTLVGYSLARAHLSDMGFATPTTYNPEAKDVYQEGLIFPCIRIQRDYRDLPDVLDICKANIRVPDHFYGDYLAMISAVRIGQARITELCRKYGVGTFLSFMDQYQVYAERMARSAIRALPKGRVTKQLLYDPIIGYPDGFPVRVTIEIDPDQEQVTVDLRDNEDNLPLGINLTEAIVLGACRQGIFSCLGPEVPRCSGAFARVNILVREGAAVGLPKFPAATSSATTDLCQSTMVVIHEAMAELGDGLGFGGSSIGIPSSGAVVSGYDSRKERYFVNQIFLASWGGPALSGHDGWFTYSSNAGAGGIMQMSVEIAERQQPMYFEKVEIRVDSGGYGEWEGLPGPTVMRPTTDAIRFMTNGASRVFPPRGVRSGGPGGGMWTWVEDAAGNRTAVPSVGDVTVRPGEAMVSHSVGGGGYGPPLKRRPELVRKKVEEGWISEQRARRLRRRAQKGRGNRPLRPRCRQDRAAARPDGASLSSQG